MTSKNITSSRFGLGKAGLSKAESDAEKLRKENGWLKRSLEELSKGRSWERERNRLLEKILALETTKQKQIHELEQKDKQILSIKDQLSTSDVDDVTSLRNQLAEKSKDAKRREQLYKSLSEETEKLKNELSAITLKCKELENSVPTLQTSDKTNHDLEKYGLPRWWRWLIYSNECCHWCGPKNSKGKQKWFSMVFLPVEWTPCQERKALKRSLQGRKAE